MLSVAEEQPSHDGPEGSDLARMACSTFLFDAFQESIEDLDTDEEAPRMVLRGKIEGRILSAKVLDDPSRSPSGKTVQVVFSNVGYEAPPGINHGVHTLHLLDGVDCVDLPDSLVAEGIVRKGDLDEWEEELPPHRRAS